MLHAVFKTRTLHVFLEYGSKPEDHYWYLLGIREIVKYMMAVLPYMDMAELLKMDRHHFYNINLNLGIEDYRRLL